MQYFDVFSAIAVAIGMYFSHQQMLLQGCLPALSSWEEQ